MQSVCITALDVAKWFLFRNNSDVKQYDGELLTHMKLQKLLYYAQGVYLAYTSGKPLFNENIEAWDHGPVVREVYDVFRGNREINFSPTDDDVQDYLKVDRDITASEVLEAVYNQYGKYSASHLRNMTHNERPWKETYVQYANNIISKELIEDYFEKEVLEN